MAFTLGTSSHRQREDAESYDLGRFDFSGIVTRSPRLRAVLHTLAQVAEAKASVLIRGQSGTGKELIGHVRGAFTPAPRLRPWAFGLGTRGSRFGGRT